ncbi:MAG TPA: alpha/beta hydrolase, partial [Steroidobacteraceae bacterium]
MLPTPRAVLGFIAFAAVSAGHASPTWHDPSQHKTRFVTVDRGVKLEVLDWGGTGRPIILIAGLGGTAHAFDDCAPNLTANFHVYGVTRRGYGASSVPRTGYSADRLGDDVVAVIRMLKLQKPLLVGHSFGGQEVSDVAIRYPDLISAVVYLDAVYSYDTKYSDEALYWYVEWKQQIQALQKHLEELLKAPSNPKSVALELRDQDLPRVARIAETLVRVENGRHGWSDPTPEDLQSFASMREWYHRILRVYLPEAEFRQMMLAAPDGRPTMQNRAPSRVEEALEAGRKAFHDIRVPALYIGAADN